MPTVPIDQNRMESDGGTGSDVIRQIVPYK
jgi:hypothetical protein